MGKGYKKSLLDLDNAFIPQKKGKEVSHIIEHPNEKVEIKFKNESPRFPIVKENMSSPEFMSSKPSTSSIRSELIPNLKIKSVRLDQGIPNIIYEENLPNSPTQTEMDTSSQLNVTILESKFELDK